MHAGLPGRRDLRSPDGVVLVDKYALPRVPVLRAGLPLRMPLHRSADHTADKCTLCYHRITKGLTTACSEVCPTGARQLVDLEEPEGSRPRVHPGP